MQPEPTSAFLDLIDLAAHEGASDERAPDGGAPAGAGAFVGRRAPERGGRTYGGQFLAQAVAAAYRTVDDSRRIHSLHAYFLRVGDVAEPTAWTVDAVRDGRSFASRSVTGSQHGAETFHMIASFHSPEDGLEHLPEPDFDLGAVPPPEDVEVSYVDFCHRQAGFDPTSWFGQDRPMEIRYINPPEGPEGVPTTEPQLTWTRVSDALPDDPAVHDAGLAYLADATLVDHVMLPHGLRWHDGRLTGASLDHAMWFVRPVRADEWLLYDQRVEATAAARGLATGRLYGADGRLAAVCSQEGLMRWTA